MKPCKVWKGSVKSNGYGQVMTPMGQTTIHRYTMEQTLGRKLRPEENVLHTCDVRNCYEPTHLYVGSLKQNSADMLKKGRHPNQKLSCDDIRYIRVMANLDPWSQVRLSNQFQVTALVISKIRRGIGHEFVPQFTPIRVEFPK